MARPFPLAEIPIEVLIDDLLPATQIPDVLSLGSTNKVCMIGCHCGNWGITHSFPKFFATVCNDDTFWKRRLQVDFNFTGAGTARTSGWKFIYKGLSQPQGMMHGPSYERVTYSTPVYVWG